jgi:hypothetical protein
MTSENGKEKRALVQIRAGDRLAAIVRLFTVKQVTLKTESAVEATTDCRREPTERAFIAPYSPSRESLLHITCKLFGRDYPRSSAQRINRLAASNLSVTS